MYKNAHPKHGIQLSRQWRLRQPRAPLDEMLETSLSHFPFLQLQVGVREVAAQAKLAGAVMARPTHQSLRIGAWGVDCNNLNCIKTREDIHMVFKYI